MRILVIEDDDKIQSFISRGLSQEGHTVDMASTGTEGLRLWQSTQYDAVVLDIMLPERNGIDLLRQMRRKGDPTPVLVLSAKSAVEDRVTGLETGADDYMAKPFSFSELTARLHAITRRLQTPAQPGKDATSLSLGGVTLDLLRRTVLRENRKIELQPREFALLDLLMRNANRPLNKTLILERIWDYSFDPQTNVVDVLVCRLRTKLDAGFSVKRIQTMRGVGYVFRTTD
ncbi:MAG: response regulator transcription factor [Kiritimatiellia bacterium]|jgi:two-component system OmpR family response regulator|nr:response regulator transcription factor [Kiritimatiellia bacterium]